MDDLVPNLETAIDLIRKCGGLVFLPHIFEYRDNALPILNYILENYEIDGIECYYTTFSKEQHKYLLNVVVAWERRNNGISYFISGR